MRKRRSLIGCQSATGSGLIPAVAAAGLSALILFGVVAPPVQCGAEEISSSQETAKQEQLDESPKIIGAAPADPATLRAVIEKGRQGVVVITFTGRDGSEQGLGSGFILSKDGLIATNLHVIGEARPISVKLLDGRTFKVASIHATDRSQDLAILKIDAEGLPVLPLGNSDELDEGEPLIAVGNPQGLEHSVVTGVSGVRKDYEGMDLIQLAMPIEQGNSGGPVLNMAGEVVGLVTLKSIKTDNLGFAVAANGLKPLLEKPNPIAMSKWLTIGVLNSRLWEPPQDEMHWSQRSSRIRVEGAGSGFGGRSLCLWRAEPPQVPYEVAVSVKIEEEDGAAGLAFHSDGEDRHYGFYPTSGSLRIARFDGPTVYSWNVLQNKRTRAWRPGDWNDLKVRVTQDGFECFCNGERVFESDDTTYTRGRIGLVKFRHTTAEFKQFRYANELPSLLPEDEVISEILAAVDELPAARPPRGKLVEELLEKGRGVPAVLEAQARELEERAARLRQLSSAVHEQRVRDELLKVLAPKSESVDLLHAALLLSALDNDEVDVELYRQQVDAMADEFLATLPQDADHESRLKAFNRWLFEEQGFHGSRTNYYSAANSYLNEVIDDREGLPITLSVLYIELGRRCGLDVVGIGLPGHFVVQVRGDEGQGKLIDPFDRGDELTELEATLLINSATGRDWDDRYLEPQSPRDIVSRMLRNLLNVANSESDSESALRYVNTLLALNPESPADRLFKAVLCLNTGRIDEGLAEVDWVVERQPDGVLMEQVHRLRTALEEQQEP
jgi:regulator of sirC expression with transglutaminase-like and TPR domain